MKFRIVADGSRAFNKSGFRDWSKLGFKFKKDKEYFGTWWLNSETKEAMEGVIVDFKTPEDIVKFLKKHGHIYFKVDEDIPTITI